MANPKLDRLKSNLMTTGLQNKDNGLFQVIKDLIEYLRTLQVTVGSISGSGSGGGSTPVTPAQIRDAGYWSPLVLSNNSASKLNTLVTDGGFIGELVVTDTGAPIMIWIPTP